MKRNVKKDLKKNKKMFYNYVNEPKEQNYKVLLSSRSERGDFGNDK